MFPTGVGMNRVRRWHRVAHNRVPHRRGDEPAALYGIYPKEACSPQAWG